MGMPYGDTPAQHDQDPSLMPGTSKHQIFYDKNRSLLSDGLVIALLDSTFL